VKLVAFEEHTICYQITLSMTMWENLEMKATGNEKMQVTIMLASLTDGSKYHPI
jgi:hypothetical protein